MALNMLQDESVRGKRRKSSRSLGDFGSPVSEINVTPMVDVMLVLLIIFMVAAPMLTVGIKVELPETKASSLTEQKEPLVITLNKKGEIFVQETKVKEAKFIAHMKSITKNNPTVKIYVRADKDLNYGKVMKIMGMLSFNDFKKFAFITESERIVSPSRKRKANNKR